MIRFQLLILTDLSLVMLFCLHTCEAPVAIVLRLSPGVSGIRRVSFMKSATLLDLLVLQIDATVAM